MPFSRLMRDTLTLKKTDGKTTKGIKGRVRNNKIYIQRSDIHIERGDELIRIMPGCQHEIYIVIDPGFHEAFHGIPSGYQSEVRRKEQTDAD